MKANPPASFLANDLAIWPSLNKTFREIPARLAPLAGREGLLLALLTIGFLVIYFLPVDRLASAGPVYESLALTKWYAREHVILCLIPAFFIAGAIGSFVSQAAVMKYLGAKANKFAAYSVASTSGTLLAVCSCTVLPLFASIWKRGAGLGPAAAFLYSGPAINVMAIILTARVLGMELGVARAVFAIVFSIVIGLAMALLFAREEQARAIANSNSMAADAPSHPIWHTAILLGAMTAILIFANWAPSAEQTGIWHLVWTWRWVLTGLFAAVLGLGLAMFQGVRWLEVILGAMVVGVLAILFPHEPMVAFVAGVVVVCLMAANGDAELGDWLYQSWDFAKKILPLLLAGVIVAGLLLGRPGHEGLIPSVWIEQSVGGNSLAANFMAAFAGALMYFATLTEVPILQGLLGSGMGKGPALALLLAGPALSLPNMIVIRSVLGTKKTLVFVGLVVVLATLSGLLFGAMF